MQERIGDIKAQRFLNGFGKICKLVDEANEITKEIKSKERLK
jgi:hypothetical protein